MNTCTITDTLYDDRGVALRDQPIYVQTNNRPVVETGGGVISSAPMRFTTDVNGVFSIPLLWASEQSPNNTSVTLSFSDGSKLAGIVPSIASTNMADLKQNHGWAAVDAQTTVVIEQGPAGPSGDYPGVTSDGAGGLILTGGIQVNGEDDGDATGDGTPWASFTGYSVFRDTPANATNGWETLSVHQSAPLDADNDAGALVVLRNGAENGHTYTLPTLFVNDSSASLVPRAQFVKAGLPAFEIGAAGGIGAFGQTSPTSQPTMTLATSTIADADTKAAVQALIGIVNGCGLAAITET